ncbi:MAG TPA: Mrp/NBP35 family ATP-binding protein [Candidatus Sabulitectum sp.]|nr:Mrp/NBP35 family ATP-binding protein [Candidatus Sabulitectum sp.]HPF32615.1 Mrp/NBP35 family ATP-binding protein [Candidatus Sabulitectum sp.]HPJ28970.1 Mrp/NBP35 family ATP-binding protein [Candidatus Sabulitectum sp.]HRW78382.1 Mrp/NBP35 family ATP-binding protein [Candidatus Sabulitectum sp.]
MAETEVKEGTGCSGNCGSCSDGSCEASAQRPGESDDDYLKRQKLVLRMKGIRHKIVVLSGKGGVGKSTVAVNLAISLSLAGKKVGLLDVDIHGPSIPTMLGLVNAGVQTDGQNLLPVEIGGLKVMSVGFLLDNRDSAVIWRGPMKMGVIEQLLRDVKWGELDYLIIDSPPGTGDEPLSAVQLVGDMDGAVMVTTPQDVAAADVRKSLDFCRQLGLPVLGIVENMSGFVCPHCGKETPIFKGENGRKMAEAAGVPFLGSIPIDPNVGLSSDAGKPFVYNYGKTETAKRFEKLIEPLLDLSEE